MSERVGIVGLGVMGEPMARNLLAAGFELTVCNRSQGAVERLAAAGAAAAGSPAELAAAVDVVVTVLPDTADVEQVLLGEDGVLAGLGPGGLAIEMSTISPLATRELAARAAERGVGFVDAPVSGGEVGAREATLAIMAGAGAEDFARAEPIFAALGRTVVHVGPVGSGQVVKACNQVAVALSIEAACEALVLGSKAGVDPAKVIEVLGGGLAGSRVLEVKAGSFLGHDFEPGFRLDLHQKDLDIALATARQHGVPLPLTAAVAEQMRALRAGGRGDRDHAVLLTLLEDLAQHRIGPT